MVQHVTSTGPLSVAESSKILMEEREKKLETQRAIQEVKDVEGCTFAPQIGPKLGRRQIPELKKCKGKNFVVSL